jgi:hypothetical protein
MTKMKAGAMTFADRVIDFNKHVHFEGELPPGIRIMNPFREDSTIIPLSSTFYKKFYDDNKRLKSECGIPYSGKETHEPSSVFVYDVVNAFGGAREFYSKIYINSMSPLGFTSIGLNGKEINYNYYDSKALTDAVYDFMVDNIRKQIAMGVKTDVCFCFGTGKNEKFLQQLNDKFKFFGKIVALEHPRFIMQYKLKSKQVYIDKYLRAFGEVE